MLKILTSLLLVSLANVTLAQAPKAAATADSADVFEIKRHQCVEPRYPGRAASGREMDKLQKTIDAYTECINAYMNEYKMRAEKSLEEQKKLVTQLNEASRQQVELKNKVQISIDEQRRYVETRNVAVNEFNQVMTELRKAAGVEDEVKQPSATKSQSKGY